MDPNYGTLTLSGNSNLNEDGLIICEYENEIPISNYDLVKEKVFGKTNIRIYKNKE